MNEMIDKLVADLDERTRVALEGRAHESAIHLYGSRESRYLKGIAGKAKKFWVPVRWFDCRPPLTFFEGPIIIDRESNEDAFEEVFIPYGEHDLDCIQHEGMSCTAEACMYILRALRAMEGKHVCIIGRGHAVKEMAEHLLARDATVMVCHSKTRDLLSCTYWADVIVNGAPGTQPLSDVTRSRNSVVLDISGSLSAWENSNIMTYIGPRDIGRLNTSLVLNRFATR